MQAFPCKKLPGGLVAPMASGAGTQEVCATNHFAWTSTRFTGGFFVGKKLQEIPAEGFFQKTFLCKRGKKVAKNLPCI